MSIRLNLNPEPRWLDLIPGVSVQVRPVTSALIHSGLSAMADQDDPGAAEAAFQKAIARGAILDWRGVLDGDGKPATVTPAHVDALLDHWLVMRAFSAKVTATGLQRQEALAAEGEGSAAAPTGTGAAASDTVENVDPSNTTVRDSAPTKSKPPKA